MKLPASAGAVNEVAKTVFAVGTFADDATGVPIFSPNLRVDPGVMIKRRNEDITGLAVAFGMIVIPRPLQTDVSKRARQGGVAKRFKGWVIHDFGCVAN